MPVSIHGKEYFTVAERLQQAYNAKDIKSITTEILSQDDRRVVVKATLVTETGTFTGMSESDPSKTIERKNPIEVAETSAVGRALAFAGYAGSEIASADEMIKALEKNQDYQATEKQRNYLSSLASQNNIGPNQIWDYLGLEYGTKLSGNQARKAIEWLKEYSERDDSKEGAKYKETIQ